MSNQKYKECSCCGKLIPYGDDIIVDKLHTGIYCSLTCWAIKHGTRYISVVELNDDTIDTYDN